MRFSELIPLIILSSALFLLAMPFFDETNPTGLSSFSAQSGQGCIDLEDSSTWHNNITSIGNRSFFLNDNITLCKKTYSTDAIHDFFVFKGSYVLDCNGSTIRGSGLGKGVLSRFNNTFIENCVFENFGTDLNILDIDENAVPNAIWNVTQNTSSQNESAFSVVVDQNGYFIVAGYDSPTGINNSQWRVVKLDKDGNVLWNWTQDPSSGIDLARSVVVDQDGNYIIAGSENLSGESQWRVVKMNKNSVVLWNFTMNVSNGSDEARSVVVDQDGNYLVVGIGGEDSYWFAVKLDKDGNVLWNWTQNASPNDDEVFSVVVDHDNNYILAGNDKVSGVNKLAWRVVKLNKSGNVLWNWTHHFSDNESAYSVVVDLNGNYVIAGYDDSFGADDLGWRVVKLDKDGNVLWNWTQDPSSGIDLARSVVVDQDGNYLIAGGDAAASDEGLRVVKLNVSGDALWNWTQNPSAKNDSAVSICVDSKGDYVVAGFDGSPAGSDSQWRIVKLSADKNALTGISLSNVSIFDDDSSETFVSLINTSATLNNFTIGYNLSVGKINYAHLSGVQGVLSLKRNIIVNPYFVSLDSSKSEASAFNSSANLTLDSNFSSCFVDLFKADGFLSSRNEILANGSVVNPSVKSCVDGRVVFSTVGAFSGYALKKSYDGCIDLFNSSTFKSSIHDKIFNVSNRSFFLNDNVALCKKTYLTDTIHDFFIFNGSYVLDCNGSTIRGSGLGKGALSVFNGSRIQNCVFQNFKCGLNILNIEKHNISTVWNWTKSFSSNIDEDLSVAVDHEGNYVMAGADGSFGGWTYEWRVVKIDKNGNILWNFSQNSSAHPYDEAEDVVVDQDGNYLIVGRYLEGSGLAWKAVKVNPDGVILWNWTQDPSSGDDTAWAVAVDQDGNYVIAGTDKAPGDYEWRAVKLDKNGNTLWNWTQNPSSRDHDYLYAVAVDFDGNYILGGTDEAAGANDWEWRVVKLDKDGNVLWNWTQNPSTGTVKELVNDVAVDRDGGIIAVGEDRCSGDGSDHTWRAVKIDKNGNTLWNWTYNFSSSDEFLRSVSIDQDGNYILAGYFESPADSFDNLWRVVKLNRSNRAILAEWTQNPSSGWDMVADLVVDDEGNYLVVGSEESNNFQWRAVKLSSSKGQISDIRIENVSIYNSGKACFLALPNASASLKNIQIGRGSGAGRIRYAGLEKVNDSLFTGSNVLFDAYFVSMNSSGLGSFASPANITLSSGTTQCDLLYYVLSGFPRNRTDIISNGHTFNPVWKNCSGGVSTFTVTGFSGYALAGKPSQHGGSNSLSKGYESPIIVREAEENSEPVVERPGFVAPETVTESHNHVDKIMHKAAKEGLQVRQGVSLERNSEQASVKAEKVKKEADSNNLFFFFLAFALVSVVFFVAVAVRRLF